MPTTDMKNPSAVLAAVGDLRIEDRPAPRPGPGEVVIGVRSVGICGSDIHYWEHGRIGDFVVESPLVLGHEAAGVVEDVAADVTDLKPGDRVAIEPGVPCRRCAACKSGRYNLCADVRFMATPPIDGALARYVAHPSDFCYRLPDHVSLDDGATLEPLSVGVHACRRGGVTSGSRVLVMGAGPVGLACLLAARAAGAAAVGVADLRQERLDVADSLGGTTAPRRQPDAAGRHPRQPRARRRCHRLLWSRVRGADRHRRDLSRRRGRAGRAGPGGDDPADRPGRHPRDRRPRRLPLRQRVPRGAGHGGVRAPSTPAPIVTHHFELEDVVSAFETARDARDGAIKVMVTI